MKRLLWVLSIVLTLAAVSVWGAVMLDDWSGLSHAVACQAHCLPEYCA